MDTNSPVTETTKQEGPTVSAPTTLLRKREQIKTSNKVLFMWVAGTSVVVAFAIVLSVFLVKQLIFNEKVLIEQAKSSSDLHKSIQNAKQLDKNLAQLRSDKNLASARADAKENNLDVIIDALPYDGNPINLGASLQDVIFKDVSFDTLAILDASPSAGSSDESSSTVVEDDIGDAQPMYFTFRIVGTQEEIQKLIKRLNSSIRPIKLIDAKFESATDNKISMAANAVTYYQSKKSFQLTDKVVKP